MTAEAAPYKVAIESPFGRLAIQRGYLTAEQLEEALRVQSAAAKAGFRKRLGDILIKKGYLTSDQVRDILEGQTTTPENKKFGEFEVLSKLGEGAMGAVYKAKQVNMDRIVALKLLSSDLAKDKDYRERFLREARAVAKLNHPNIVMGIQVGSSKGVYYFAMEYVQGDSMGGILNKKGKLPEKQALEWMRQTALALHHAHNNGLLHRDVKPDNILISSAGEAKLADLGLARSIKKEDPHASTKGLAVGTPFYMSPEQARGKSDLTAGTDLYSLGATLYHALTGQPPYDGTTAGAIMLKHVTDPVPDPRAVNPKISKHAAEMCMKLMQKEPKDRYKSGQKLADDLNHMLHGAPKPSSRQSSRVINLEGLKNEESPKKPTTRTGSPIKSETRVRQRRRGRRGSDEGGFPWAIVGVGAVATLMVVFFLMRQGATPAKSKEKDTAKQTPTVLNEPPNTSVAKTPANRTVPAVPVNTAGTVETPKTVPSNASVENILGLVDPEKGTATHAVKPGPKGKTKNGEEDLEAIRAKGIPGLTADPNEKETPAPAPAPKDAPEAPKEAPKDAPKDAPKAEDAPKEPAKDKGALGSAL